ncbi:hypothetical protein GCM10023091_08520 [Ravibacter arvi]|uniref:Cytochrome c domain-containing protein n=1 Tax=Ravibacter arvi TaxID=2051041 RepID=A0ABP8LR12_9BACT
MEMFDRKSLVKKVKPKSKILVLPLLVILFVAVVTGFSGNKSRKAAVGRDEVAGVGKSGRHVPAGAVDTLSEEDADATALVDYGYRLITETYAWVGPGTKRQISGNRLACSSCHLDGGTRAFAAPYVGLDKIFPTYIARENKVETLEERINGCFERSLNGRAIAVDDEVMVAMVAYIKHISRELQKDGPFKGRGFVSFKAPDRAADPKNGAAVYEANCAACHGADGKGVKGVAGNREGGYIFPPLWGEDSYNDGAGMNRLITAARFIKGNMPLGVTHESPLLSDDEAYDVAAYINSKLRPVKANKEKDYPDLSKKPKDCPYPPYQDNVTQEQHRIGPFNF